MSTLVFDFETIPNENLIPNAKQLRDTLRPPSNYKNEDAIERWKEQQMLDLISKMALHPMTGRIASAGCILVDGEDVAEKKVITLPSYNASNSTECTLLDTFTDFAESATRFITFNGKKFDVPFYEVRSRITGAGWVDIPTYPYDQSKHVDLMLAIGNPMRLDEIRAWYGIGKRTQSLGDQVWRLWQEGKTQEISDHCEDDIDATLELAKILNFVKPTKEAMPVNMEDFQ